MLVGDASVVDGEWHHVVAVRDGTAEKNLLYLDGDLAAEMPYTYSLGFDANTQLNIGWLNMATSTKPSSTLVMRPMTSRE